MYGLLCEDITRIRREPENAHWRGTKPEPGLASWEPIDEMILMEACHPQRGRPAFQNPSS